MKTSQITKYLFKRQIVILGEMYLVTFAAIYILPLLLSLITGTLHDYSFVRILKTSPITGFFSFFMFVIATLSYENFKFLIQNGISRKTFFEAQITVYGLFILIGNTVNLVYNYLIYTPMTNRDT
ncbi:MAG: ABC transporter permease, partial [Lentilactobacillus hilgardii]